VNLNLQIFLDPCATWIFCSDHDLADVLPEATLDKLYLKNKKPAD